MSATTDAWRQVWELGSARLPGCALPGPWWANRVTWLVGGGPVVFVAGVMTPAEAPFTTVLLMMGVPFALVVVVVLLAEWLDNRRVPWHLHCDDCGLCSIGAGVPGARTVRGADTLGLAYGWYVNEPNDVTVCPACLDALLPALPEAPAA